MNRFGIRAAVQKLSRINTTSFTHYFHLTAKTQRGSFLTTHSFSEEEEEEGVVRVDRKDNWMSGVRSEQKHNAEKRVVNKNIINEFILKAQISS